MLKYIKHHLDTIAGVEIYPIFSLILFFAIFTIMIIYVFKMSKSRISEISNLPLENDSKNDDNE